MSNLSVLLRSLEGLRARAPKGLVRFLCVGMVGLASHAGVFTLLFHFGLAKTPAWCAGLAISTLVTWRLNRRMTFAVTGRRSGGEALRYAMVTGVAQGTSYIVFRSICALDGAFPPQLALIAGAVVATVFSYTGHRFFTFTPPKSPADDASKSVQEVPVA